MATSSMVSNTVSAISRSSTLPPVDYFDSMILSSQQKADPQLKAIIESLTNHNDVFTLTTQTSNLALITMHLWPNK